MYERVDVVIIGGGFAGLSVAIEATLQGKRVLVLEKMATIGGNSVISDGGIAAPNTDLQDKYSIDDSMELMKEDILKAGKYKNKEYLVDILVNKAKDGFEWTRDFLGVEYLNRVDIFGGHSIQRCYTPKNITGRDLIQALKKKCQELGIEIRTKVLVKEILMKDDIVEGVEVVENYQYPKEEKERTRIYAENGVVLASGGYGENETLIQLFKKEFAGLETTNKPSADNRILEHLLDTNIQMVDLEEIQLLPSTSIDERGFGSGSLFGDYIVFPYGILLDKDSMKRFTSELIDRGRLSEAMINHAPYCFGVADQKAVDKSGWDIEKLIKKGVVKTYPDIKSLAKGMEGSIDDLRETVDRYNVFIEKGKDEDYDKPLTNQEKMAYPPFYVMRMYPKIHHTMGGVAINQYGQVLANDNQPIKGFFAAGEVTGGVHGAARLGSMAVTDCVVFGRIVGQFIGQQKGG